jgi:uncharacterized protein with HEPN domain
MLKTDAVRLHHILDSAREAVAFCHGRARGDLEADRQLGLSVVHLLEIVGEAARSVSADLRAAHPEIARAKMAGMRDRLIHGYFDVNLDVVWKTVQEDSPPLITQLENVLRSQGV